LYTGPYFISESEAEINIQVTVKLVSWSKTTGLFVLCFSAVSLYVKSVLEWLPVVPTRPTVTSIAHQQRCVAAAVVAVVVKV